MLEMEHYRIRDTSGLLSPGLLLFQECLDHNLAETIRLCGGPERWCPHVKTHKTREIVRRQQGLGVTKFKCATIAEAEMLASEGVSDILIAYPLVGPNVNRLSILIDKFPDSRFATLFDDPHVADGVSDYLASRGQKAGAFLDLNSGMDRTGIVPGPLAIELYEQLAGLPGLEVSGLHWYDGHHRQADPEERRRAVMLGWERLLRFRDTLLLQGFEIPRIIAGGSGSFAILAETGEPNLELSPGTTTLYDADCCERFSELNLRPALAILTRVVSTNDRDRITLDVGHKSCAADQPAGKRLFIPGIPDAVEQHHTEEHLVLQTSRAGDFQVGDALLVFPRHVCPTMAVHASVQVVANGEVVDEWRIAARDRVLTV